MTKFQGLHYVGFFPQWLFFPKCDFYGSHKQKQQALFDLFKKKKSTPNTSQPAFERNHLGAREKSLHLRNSDDEIEPGFVGHMQPLPVSRRQPGWIRRSISWSEWNSEDFWCWGLEVMVGLVIFPGIGIHFHWAFRLWLWTTNLNHQKVAVKLSSVSLQLSPTLSSKTRPGSFHPGLCMQLLKSWR